ncbi:uncharacterized protein LOC100875012 isoform X1 [Megachile rotundata]|uniref:uncharacterized protein LOC100875012 isoform X1 n=2 Tax=Megachile rotundata TaxID=143995 RepID=UPI003FD4CCAF
MDNYDLNNANEVDNEHVQSELKGTNSMEKSDQITEQDIYKSSESKNHSDDEIETNTSDKLLESKDKQEIIKENGIHTKLSTIVDSDSEDENMFISKSKSTKAIYDSSEDEMFNSNQNNKCKIRLNKKKNTDIINDNDNEEVISPKKKISNDIQNRFQSLIDLDSETDEEKDNHKKDPSPIRNKKVKKQDEKNSKSKMKKVSLRASKMEAMKQIQIETQRLIRETEVSLPYHRPKQRSLQDFLSRKKIMTVLPKAPTMAAKLKMSSAIVDEVLKEKEKEAEIFYKSSDSEDEIVESHSSDKENLESKQEFKNNNISRKLFTGNNLLVNNTREQDTANEVQKTQELHETSIETKENEDNKVIEDNGIQSVNDSMIVEVHCDAIDAENINEMSKLEMVQSFEKFENDEINSALLSKDVTEIVENESKKQNTCSDNEKTNIEASIESLEPSVPKINNDYANLVKQSLGLNVNELDEYNEYGLPPPKFNDSPNINEKKSLLNLKNLKPKLKGTPGTMIDLSDDVKTNKDGISALIERFMNKHSKNKKYINDTSNVTATHIIESPNGVSVVKETLPYKVSTVANEDPKLKNPGAKLVRLKEELKHKMALKRDEEWKQREQEMKEQEIEWDESIIEEEHLNDPCSPSIESDRSDEDELEENDVCIKKEKKKKKSAYIDDEADVSTDEISDSDEVEDEEENEDEILEQSEDEKDEANNICDSNDEGLKCKTFKRIVESLEDDSRSSNTESIENTTNENKKASFSQIIKTDIFNMDANDNVQSCDDESDIQVSQGHMENDLKCQTPQIKTNYFDFVSPVTQLTALNEHIESEEESPEIKKQSPIRKIDLILNGYTLSQESSQQLFDKKQALPQRKLFVDQTKLLDEELTQNKLNLSKEPSVTESQLLDLCSGTFSSQVNDLKQSTNEFLGEISQSCQISSEKESQRAKDIYTEKQQFSKDIASWNKLKIVSSDEEDIAEDEINNRSKKKVKKLDLSDDESERSCAESSDEVEKEDADQDKYIDYDSEENEVVVSKKNIKQYATKFLEEEAELSESDCDVSADEDEEELDKLELEEADDEEIDESKVKDQLEQLHVKQILHEDQKEVRMLKELLFEDGDLFSESTRERKFKWRNIDKQDNNDDSPILQDKDGWVDISDDEEEANWRKIKHEREKFLAEKVGTIDAEIEEDLNKSEVFKFGMKILKKRKINVTDTENTLIDHDYKMKSRIPHTVAEMLNNTKLEGGSRVIHSVLQKRSFLAKGEQSLARLAALARQKETTLPSLNTKNFVFTHIDPSAEEDSLTASKIQPKSSKARKNT